MQSEQHVIYRLMEGVGEEAQYDMEEIDGSPPTRVTAVSGISQQLLSTLKKGAPGGIGLDKQNF